jgi:predicted RND superfamily exporter protein
VAESKNGNSESSSPEESNDSPSDGAASASDDSNTQNTDDLDHNSIDQTGEGVLEPDSFLARWSTPILCLTLFLLPLIGFGAAKSLKVYANDVRQWLPEGYEEAATYDAFLNKFGIDEMAVMSWPECRIDNPDVIAFQEELKLVGDEEGLYFQKVTSGPQVLAQLEAIGVKRAFGKKRLDGLMIGPDKQTTCLIATPTARMVDRRRELVEQIYKIAEEKFQIAATDLHMAGPTMDGAAIDSESKKSLNQFLWVSVVTVFLLAWFRMRDFPLTILVMVFSMFSASIALSILFWTGGKMNLTMVMLPTLVFILGVSGSVHMVNYYRKASIDGHGMRSADVSIRDGGYPIFLSSVTTAIGLLSLGTSQVAPIRFFGFYSAMGILASIPIIVFVLPSTLYFFKGRISKRFSSKGKLKLRERRTGVSRSTSMLMYWVIRTHGWVVVPALISLTLLGVGISQLKASVKIQNRFAGKAKIIQDYHWLESKLGPLVPMEIVITCNPECELTLWQQMQVVQGIERAVKRTTAVNATMSAATFEPILPKGNRLRAVLDRETKLTRWEQEFASLEKASLVKRVGDETTWRISLRVAALNDIDYGRFLETVNQNVQEQLLEVDRHGLSAVLTGGIPLVYKAQRQILRDLMISFVTAFLLITVVLMCVLSSFRAGLIAMIPNIFPPLVVFGAMGWLGQSIEIGSVMTASVALGIAVDDTLHYLTWYRRGLMQGMSRNASIRHAFQHCAKAMIDTSLICGLGVAPFLFSVFMPTVKFSGLLCILLMTALVGDLMLLPAILAGPAGRFFRLKPKKPKAGQPTADESMVDNALSDDFDRDAQ